jgi:antitoxin MazE
MSIPDADIAIATREKVHGYYLLNLDHSDGGSKTVWFHSDVGTVVHVKVTIAAFRTLPISNHTEQFIIEALRKMANNRINSDWQFRCASLPSGYAERSSFPRPLTSPQPSAILRISINKVCAMVTKIQKWGNSQGLRINRQLLERARLAVGDEVDVEVRDGVIVVAPVQQVRGKYSLDDLVQRIPKGYEPTGEEWGGPVGKEVW